MTQVTLEQVRAEIAEIRTLLNSGTTLDQRTYGDRGSMKQIDQKALATRLTTLLSLETELSEGTGRRPRQTVGYGSKGF
jgi:hypothetical protein